ncbi:MAG: choice-of-anchor tandem repeat GloVer-containing protein [Verrucomicrobiota bacterium]|jgi:uncharacterized repeat protein (TIGR03803 family)
MRRRLAFAFLAVMAALVLETSARGAASPAPAVKIIYSLPAGDSPAGALLQGLNGSFYGATATGGAGNFGAIFEVTPGGILTNLYSFNGANGAAPLAGVIQDGAGNLYGTASGGGPTNKGTVFKISPGGGISVLAAFYGTNGANPQAPLARGTNGWFYGATFNGGANGKGCIFQVNAAGVLSNVYSFSGSDGANPGAGLMAGTDGYLYGTTVYGGANGLGTVFRLTYAGALTNLASFSSSSGFFPGGLAEDAGGNLYGATVDGGANSAGTIFKLTPRNTIQTLLSFNLANGSNPNSPLVLGSDGNLYGTALQGGTKGFGTIFTVSPSGLLSDLVSFAVTNGAYPHSPLILGTDGNFYGTTASSANNSGEIFQLTGFGPHIIKQPANQKWVTNGSASFSVKAGGSAPLAYQWLFDGSAIAGATNSSYGIKPEQLTNAGTYAVIVSNANGFVTSSDAVLALSAPTITIKAPPAVVTSNSLTLSGTAADRFGLQMVQWQTYQTNLGGTWLTASNSNPWSALVTLQPGTNFFAARSVDLFNNYSVIKKATVFYSTLSWLTLQTNGAGSIIPGFKGSNLVVGRGYTVRAVPGAGQLFSNWSGAISRTNNPLAFTMQSNMVLAANFVPNPFPPVTGIYNGLFYDTNNGVAAESAGLLAGLVVGKLGGYSGTLVLAGVRHGLSGGFGVSGNASHTINRSRTQGGPLVVDLTLNWSVTPPQLTGSVSPSSGAWTAALFAERASNTLNSAEYTMLLPPATNAPSNSPPGYGYALLTNHAGTVTLSGSVADGAAFSQTVAVAPSGDIPLYASLYGNTGLLFGWLNLSNGLSGTNLWWVRPASFFNLLYSDGFTNAVSIYGSPWTNPPIASTNGQLTIAGGNLPQTLPFTVEILNDLLLPLSATNAPTNSLTGSINTKTGYLKVTFGDGNGRATLAGRGAFLQNSNFGGGYFTNKTSAGTITLQP